MKELMSIEDFLNQDSEVYQLKNNPELLNDETDELSAEELEELIDKLVIWYQAKYPDCIIEERLKSMPDFLEQGAYDQLLSLSSYVLGSTNFKQLIKTLPYKQRNLLECDFGTYTESLRVSICHMVNEYDDRIETWVSILVPKETKEKESSSFYILSSQKDSDMLVSNLFCVIYRENPLEEIIYNLVEENADKIDSQALEELIKKYNDRIDLRHQLLQLVALKIFSLATTKEMGYVRAKLFISEMNIGLGLILTMDDIDDIYYSEEPKEISEFIIQEQEKIYQKKN